MTANLTKANLRKLIAAGKPAQYSVPQNTGLSLRVISPGSAAWMFTYKSDLDGKRKRMVVGGVDGDDFGIDAAKAEAAELRTAIHDNRIAIAKAKQQGGTGPIPYCPATLASFTARKSNQPSLTVAKALATYLDDKCPPPLPTDAPHIQKRKRSNRSSQTHLATLFMTGAGTSACPDLSDMPLAYLEKIDRNAVRARRAAVRDIVASGPRKTDGVASANRGAAYFRAFVNWAIDEKLGVNVNPFAGVRAINGERETPRDRVYSAQELRDLWAALDSGTLSPDFRDVWQLVTLTGMRQDEAASIKFTDIETDPATKTNMIAIRDAKTRAGQRLIPVTRRMQAILDRASDRNLMGPYLFGTSTEGAKPFSGWSKQTAKLRDISNVDNPRLHDMRRTARTRMAALGIDRRVAKLLVGHATGDAMDEIYDRHQYTLEKLAALNALDANIMGDVGATEDA